MRRVREAMMAAHRAAIDEVGGRESVARHLRAHPVAGITHVASVGKAAAPMMAGALEVLGDAVRDALVITKYHHLDGLGAYRSRVRCMESAHPVPDESCLHAGEALWRFFRDAPVDARFALLVSGGASALVERLAPGLHAQFLSRMNAWLLAGAYPIGAMNRVRKRVSTIKGGRLARALAGREALCLMISDVPGDDPKVIGSGLLIAHDARDIDVSDLPLPPWLAAVTASPPPLADAAEFAHTQALVIANPRRARERAAQHLRALGLDVTVHATLLEGDALDAGEHVVASAAAAPGTVHVWGSETTVRLPDEPGRGGRCQSLALAAACALAREGLVGEVLAAGTDGTDGPGEDAGAIVDEGTLRRAAPLDAERALARADAGSLLAASGDLLRTGPTGTNVMDLLMAYVVRPENPPEHV